MNSINELRLLSTGPVSLADPGRLAAKAATPGSAVQTAEAVVRTAEIPRPAPEAAAPQNSAPGAPPETPEASANAISESARIHQRFARFETMDYADGIPDREFKIGDLVDVLNPLQHIPIVGSVYRSVTGDEISGPAKIMGGLLYGGPIGFIAAMVATIAEQEVGQDLGQAAVAALFGGEETGDVLLAERAADALAAPVGILDRLPAGPAAISAAMPAGAPVTTGAGPQAALSGPAALDAFMQDIGGAGQASPISGFNSFAEIEVVPLPPLAQPAPNPQLAENVKVGAIEPGPLGWTIQRNAEPAATAQDPSPRAVLANPLAADFLAEAAQISEQAFSERMLQALDKYQAMSRTKDAGRPATELDIQL